MKISIVSSNPKAAIYIDNGHDQTAIDRLMTKDEKKEMELEILNLLGLPNRPRKINKSPLKKSAPRFLLDIYKSLMNDENDENNRSKRSSDINLSGEEQQQIDQSDVIMTFESISKFFTEQLVNICYRRIGEFIALNIFNYKMILLLMFVIST
ncbi:hypothetical protein NQ314_009375 [Rhamnusium bicolor]|uniref:TGF-beta propeptide domain-containing protein n=1 Tax=Rhamnusium bicolor TaxID=1586634 RepID=A0AAV8Y302_9CUCU|nr:hypothetical protein NQ314_009375 [Rhamnusium bicolor]